MTIERTVSEGQHEISARAEPNHVVKKVRLSIREGANHGAVAYLSATAARDVAEILRAAAEDAERQAAG